MANMLMNLLFGLSTMIACLLSQSLLVIAAIRYFRRHEHWLNKPSLWSSSM
jgi:uncharacterized membrane protein